MLPAGESPKSSGACRYITPGVIALGHFDVSVSKVTDSPGRDGVSFCEYGDEPNPNLIGVSSILLLDIPPTAQRAQHKTARQAALAAADMCVTGSLRELGPTGGVGSFAAFCVSTPGSVRGGWVQNDDVFSLSYFTPSDAQRSVADRLARFQAIATAVSRNIG